MAVPTVMAVTCSALALLVWVALWWLMTSTGRLVMLGLVGWMDHLVRRVDVLVRSMLILTILGAATTPTVIWTAHIPTCSTVVVVVCIVGVVALIVCVLVRGLLVLVVVVWVLVVLIAHRHWLVFTWEVECSFLDYWFFANLQL